MNFDTFRVRIANVRASDLSWEDSFQDPPIILNSPYKQQQDVADCPDDDVITRLPAERASQLYQVSAGLPPSDVICRIGFDSFKHACTPSIDGPDRHPDWRTFQCSFLYETQFAHKLRKKHVVLSIWHRPERYKRVFKTLKVKRKREFIGSAAVDLYTLATGPISHSLQLRNARGHLVPGLIQFECQMEHVARLVLALKQVKCEIVLNSRTGHGPNQHKIVKLFQHDRTSRDSLDDSSDGSPQNMSGPLLYDDTGELRPAYLKFKYTNERDSLPTDSIAVHSQVAVFNRADLPAAAGGAVLAPYDNDPFAAPSPTVLRLEWPEAETLDFHCTVRELYNYRLRIAVKQGKRDYVGTADLDFRDLHWPGRERAVPFNALLDTSENLSRESISARVQGLCYIRGGPQFYPMMGGRNTDEGVLGGRPWSDRLPVPKRWNKTADEREAALRVLEESRRRREAESARRASGAARQVQSSGLPAGWESRVTRTGQVYFLNHKTKQTQWEHPGLSSSQAQASDDEKCSSDDDSDAQVAYADFTKHPVSASYAASVSAISNPSTKTSLDTSDTSFASPPYDDITGQEAAETAEKARLERLLAQPLPSPWEERVDPWNRKYFANLDTRTTQWEDPRLVRAAAPSAAESTSVRILSDDAAAPVAESDSPVAASEAVTEISNATASVMSGDALEMRRMLLKRASRPQFVRRESRRELPPHLSTIPPETEPPFEGIPETPYSLCATNPFRQTQVMHAGEQSVDSAHEQEVRFDAVDPSVEHVLVAAQQSHRSAVLEFALGGAMGAAINAKGYLFAWGAVDGAKKEGMTLSLPREVPNIVRVRTVSCGKRHTLALGVYGKCWAFGANDYGQLGFAPGSQPAGVGTFSQPYPIDALVGRTLLVISAGCEHSLALTDRGNVFAWGRAEAGQLGTDESEYTEVAGGSGRTPALVQRFGDVADVANEHVRVVSVIAGGDRSAALDQNGDVFHWGGGARLPAMVDSLSGRQVVQMALSDARLLVLTARNRVYSCFPEKDTPGTLSAPLAVNELKGPAVVSIAAGKQMCAAVIADGSIGVWGVRADRERTARHGRAIRWLNTLVSADAGEAQTQMQTQTQRQQQDEANGEKLPSSGEKTEDEPNVDVVSVQNPVAQVKCGSNFCGVLTKGNDLYLFGSGKHGRLGLGDSHDRPLPRLVHIDAKNQAEWFGTATTTTPTTSLGSSPSSE